MKSFLKKMALGFDVSPSGARIAVVSYSTTARTSFDFNSQQNVSNIMSLIDRIRHQRGFTFIDRGLSEADKNVFDVGKGMRPDNLNIPRASKILNFCYLYST